MNHKQAEVRELVKKYDISLIGLLDTRVQESKMHIVLSTVYRDRIW